MVRDYKKLILPTAVTIALLTAPATLHATTGSEANQDNQVSESKELFQQTVNGILVDHGKHHYGVKSQQEYDKVMEKVRSELEGYQNNSFGGINAKGFEAYLEGERWDGDRSNTSRYNIALYHAQDMFGDLLEAEVNEETIKDVVKIRDVARNVTGQNNNSVIEGADSAYDHLFNNVRDCYTYSYLTTAFFDEAGYNTMIVGTDAHAEPYVEIEGKWYEVGNGPFTWSGYETKENRVYGFEGTQCLRL